MSSTQVLKLYMLQGERWAQLFCLHINRRRILFIVDVTSSVAIKVVHQDALLHQQITGCVVWILEDR